MQVDKDGYLVNVDDWNKAIAEELAEKENIQLTSMHWEVINELRTFYLNYKMLPTMRLLFNNLEKKLGANCPSNSNLQLLFPAGLFRQASKIAGLPKPVRCI
jgi:tRNA 2-thiouridine synthesizing protein E